MVTVHAPWREPVICDHDHAAAGGELASGPAGCVRQGKGGGVVAVVLDVTVGEHVDGGDAVCDE